MRHTILIIAILALSGCGMTPTPVPDEPVYCSPAFYKDPDTGERINLCPPDHPAYDWGNPIA